MNNGKKEYVFTWFIEHYSYCWHKIGESLFSPEFTTDGLENTVWSVMLRPRGSAVEDTGCISLYLFLKRVQGTNGPEKFPLKFELSFLAADGSPLRSVEAEHTFEIKNACGCPRFLKIDEDLLQRKADYLPQDTLSVRCRLWKDEGIAEQVTLIYARTRIEIEQVSFIHVIEGFSAVKPNQKKNTQLLFPVKKECIFTSSIYVTDGSCCEGKIMVKITPSSKQVLSKINLFLLDASGNVMECGEVDNRFNTSGSDIRQLSLSLTNKAILSNRSEYLPNDRLSVLCECVFSTGDEYKIIEKTLYELPFAALNQLSNTDHGDNESEEVSDYPSALDDLIDVYNNQFLTDVELKTKTKSFFAHKIMLCARSPVFKVMMSNDMKEKNTHCINIDDLDDDIVQQLLLFLYSDNIKNLQWEATTKLYYAADKYEIKKLKLICTDFLEDNLSTGTASELLLLADTHNDSYLKKVVEDFILDHEEEIFGSGEWEKLIETNPQLVIKTMHLKYRRNKVHVK